MSTLLVHGILAGFFHMHLSFRLPVGDFYTRIRASSRGAGSGDDDATQPPLSFSFSTVDRVLTFCSH